MCQNKNFCNTEFAEQTDFFLCQFFNLFDGLTVDMQVFYNLHRNFPSQTSKEKNKQ